MKTTDLIIRWVFFVIAVCLMLSIYFTQKRITVLSDSMCKHFEWQDRIESIRRATVAHTDSIQYVLIHDIYEQLKERR